MYLQLLYSKNMYAIKSCPCAMLFNMKPSILANKRKNANNLYLHSFVPKYWQINFQGRFLRYLAISWGLFFKQLILIFGKNKKNQNKKPTKGLWIGTSLIKQVSETTLLLLNIFLQHQKEDYKRHYFKSIIRKITQNCNIYPVILYEIERKR